MVLFLLSFGVMGIYIYYYNRWKHLWSLDANIAPDYVIRPNTDTTLRVAMIGDSWSGLHHEQNMDAYLSAILEQQISGAVLVESKGKGGEKTR